MKSPITSTRGVARFLQTGVTWWYDAAKRRLRWVGPDGGSHTLLDDRDGGGGGSSDHATLSHLDYASSGHTGFLSAAAAAAGYQPLHATLTALAALSTTTYGRAFLELANQAGLMALLRDADASNKGVAKLGASGGAEKYGEIGGVAVSGTPTVGQVPMATSSTTAAWTSLMVVIAVWGPYHDVVAIDGSIVFTASTS